VTIAPEALLLDLFGTLVFIDEGRLPPRREGLPWFTRTLVGFEEVLATDLPGVAPGDFLHSLARVGSEVAERKRIEGIEVRTPVRFELALRACGAGESPAGVVAARLAASHMEHLARAVVCPPGRVDLLARLASRLPLALLSNFDDAATAHRVVTEAGLAPLFRAMVISAEEGIRKPRREIFEATCARIGAEPGLCLHVGDSHVEDIEGATGAGLRAVWVNPERGLSTMACATIGDVDELPLWLGL
jgi:HAD superfamily hydrolase (TIGR01549 family)